MTKTITKQDLQNIFTKCMNVKKVFISSCPEDEGSWSSIEPKIIIRDFEVEMPLLSSTDFNSTFDLNNCDKEFDNFEEAWEYFQTINKYRIMSADGSIFVDNYCKG